MLKEGNGPIVKHGDKVLVSWRVKRIDNGEVIAYSEIGKADEFDFSKKDAWYYIMVGLKEGSSFRFKVNEQNFFDKRGEMRCAAVIVKILDEN